MEKSHCIGFASAPAFWLAAARIALRRAAVITALLAAAGAASAQALPAELLACRDITAADERLACYDRVVGRDARKGPPAASASPPSPAKTPPAGPRGTHPDAAGAAPLPSQEELFGRDPADVQRRMEQATGHEELQRITGEVVELIEITSDRIAVKLDNGQIWRQTDPGRFFLREGHEVEIRRASLGSYMMRRAGSNRSIRVERAN